MHPSPARPAVLLDGEIEKAFMRSNTLKRSVLGSKESKMLSDFNSSQLSKLDIDKLKSGGLSSVAISVQTVEPPKEEEPSTDEEAEKRLKEERRQERGDRGEQRRRGGRFGI